jgi:hypothetical protein
MRRTKRRLRDDMLDVFDFPRTRYWRPTEAWERAWRRNLARAPRKHTVEESLAIKHLVLDWREQDDPNTRGTQEELAATLGVSKQYINRLVHTLPTRIPLPPTRHPSIPVRPASTSTSSMCGGLEGHGWNCECGGCRAQRAIDAALKAAKQE